jgi:predicted nucleic acid-binding protein
MKYILDASVALKWVLPENNSGKAIELQEAFEKGGHELLAPDTFPIEVAHALTRAERKGALRPGEAISRLSRVLATSPDIYPYLPLLPRAVELSSQFRIGVYDCLYVALAEREGCELVTADEKLAKALPGFPIVSLASL